MKKNSFTLALALFTLPLIAQVSGNYQQNAAAYGNANNAAVGNDNKKVVLPVVMSENTTVLQAEVLYNAKPTSYLAIFAVTQEGETIAQTDTFINQRLDIFRRALRQIGFTDNQIYVDFISLVPKYDMQMDKKRRSKTANEIPIGFQSKKNVHIQFTDSRVMDKIISAAATAEIFDLAKVEVDVPDVKRLHDEIRAEALKIIAAKAKMFETFNIKAIPYALGDNFETYYPTELYESYTASTTDFTQLQANQSYKQNKLSVKYANKDRTVFYNRLPYDQFDMVINPEFVEPPIQIHYKLTVKYTIENNELAVKRELNIEKEAARQSQIRREEVEIRKIQAANPPKTCCGDKIP